MAMTELERQLSAALQRLAEQSEQEQTRLGEQVTNLQTQVATLSDDYQQVLTVCEELRADYERLIQILNER